MIEAYLIEFGSCVRLRSRECGPVPAQPGVAYRILSASDDWALDSDTTAIGVRPEKGPRESFPRPLAGVVLHRVRR